MRYPTSRLIAAALAIVIAGFPSAMRAQNPPPAPAPAAVKPMPPAPLDAATLQKKIDELIDGHMKVSGFSGSVLLARDGQPLMAKGYGYANVEWQIPNTPNTKFRIGSITKQFTSMIVMQLREQGKVKLEDSVCLYVSPCPDTWKPVTIHHLLTHTSGIPTYTGIPAWREVNMAPKTTDQIIGFFRDLPLQWTPGERYAYNNSGYFLLGVIIEKITGRKYEQALQEMILTPLGLSDTGYDWSKTIIARRADGYSGSGANLANTPPLDMQHPYAAGSMYSTVEDLLKWDQALYTTRLLPEAAKQIMWTPFRDNYAYGWNVAPAAANAFGGYRRVMHGGGINGFSAMIVRLPEPKMTAIVLCNNDSASASTVARDIMAIYYGHTYAVPAVTAVAKIDPKVIDQYVGEYELKPGALLTITREEDRMMVQPPGGRKAEFLPSSETQFFLQGQPITITFVKNAGGTVTHLLLVQGGTETRATKVK